MKFTHFFYYLFFILVPNTGAQTGGNSNNGGTGGATNSADILLELQYLRNNLTALKNDVANTPKVKS